jgi:hypothetical protein
MRIRLVRLVASTGEKKNAYRISVRRPEGKNHVKDIGVDARIILQWISKFYDGKGWSGLIWLMIGIIGGVFRMQ